jgi:hypothetical protein
MASLDQFIGDAAEKMGLAGSRISKSENVFSSR